MNLDIAAERERLQAMRDNPQSDLERAIKKDWLDKGSNPREWSDETVTSAHYAIRVYEMGWNRRAQPVSEQEPVAWCVANPNSDEPAVLIYGNGAVLKPGDKLFAAPPVSSKDADDAARYRWLRNEGCNFVWAEIGAGNFRKGLDDAIDAAMGVQEGSKG